MHIQHIQCLVLKMIFSNKGHHPQQQLWMKSQLCSHLSVCMRIVNMVQHTHHHHGSTPGSCFKMLLSLASKERPSQQWLWMNPQFCPCLSVRVRIVNTWNSACRHCAITTIQHQNAHQRGAWCVLGAQGVVFKWSAPSPTTIVAKIKLYLCLKNNIICLTGQHCAAEAARRPLRKIKIKINSNLFLSLKMIKEGFLFRVFILSVCFVFFLGLLGFELETPTANTRSTLRGPWRGPSYKRRF